MPVIASVELDYIRASGRGARESECGDAGLCSGADEADFFRAFNRRGDQFREFDFDSGRRAEAKSIPRLLNNRLDDSRTGMSEDCRAVGAYVIEIAGAVRVDKSCAEATLDKNWGSADRLPGAHWRIHGTRNLNNCAI